MFDFSTAFLISKISAFDSFSKCLIFKMRSFGFGEGKRQNEFAEWHVAWLAE